MANHVERAEGPGAYAGHTLLVIITVVILVLSRVHNLHAEPTTAEQAQKVVQGWLRASPQPLGERVGRQIVNIEIFNDQQGHSLYYVVHLADSGFVIVPADDLVEPIIALVPAGSYDPSTDNPLGALVSSDLAGRLDIARTLQAGGVSAQTVGPGQQARLQRAASSARRKWQELQDYAEMVGTAGVGGVSDIRVEPLVLSTWGQADVNGLACYNYYTPPGPDGDADNCPCGCVATAMAQYMRFREYPTTGIGVNAFTINVNGGSQTAYTRGGDGAGGPYPWGDSNMPLNPDETITTEQRQAIGALCYDAGVSVNMSYTSSSSSADTLVAKRAFVQVFGYSNAVKGYNSGSNIGAGLTGMVNPNLDAGNCVLLGITGPSGGHAIIADGYGYDSDTLYHHLNMGWSGDGNAWYNLPDINSTPAFTSVYKCVYNIFTSGNGEIVSGRVTDALGNPLGNVIVTAEWDGDPCTTATDSNGIYALVSVPSNTVITVSAAKAGWKFENRVVVTGTSSDYGEVSGNVWGVDFVGVDGGYSYVEFDRGAYSPGATVGITLSDMHLIGEGSENVVVKTCSGDYETVTLTETVPLSGIFKGSIGTAAGTPTGEDGTIEISEQGEIIVVTYIDANDGSGGQAVLKDAASIGGSEVIVAYEANFTDGLPTGWSIVDNYSQNGPNTWNWQDYGDRGSAELADWNEPFMIVDSDYARFTDMDEELVTASLDCTNLSGVTLRFRHYFKSNNDEKAEVDVRLNGQTWQNIAHFEGATTEGIVELPLSDYGIDGEPNVQIRWHYFDAYFDWWWAVDDVQILANTPAKPTPGDFEPDCDVDLADYSLLASAWYSGPNDADWNPTVDINEPLGIIDERDLAVLVENWLSLAGQ